MELSEGAKTGRVIVGGGPAGVLDQIGLAQLLHELPHAKIRLMRMVTSARTIDFVDLSRLKTKFPYIMMMPQFDFLEFLCTRAEQLPSFQQMC